MAQSGAPAAEPAAEAGVSNDPIEALVDAARRLQGVCIAAGLTVSAAESCTGGLLTHVLTEVPGSSGYLLGGVVSYADTAKMALLGVPAEHLAAHGAVSAQVARAMAQGARERFGSDLAVAITGVAGPDGGSDAKPVGLTYVAVADPGGVEVRRFAWNGDRGANKRDSAGAAIDLLLARAEALASAIHPSSSEAAERPSPPDEAVGE
ncbi:MAG: CinA family protein [Chloroflexi bacterium]|nr:MAG: CinA family protein [Chloroflexota bacterium]